ncbi:MAG TPA: PP2C family protein-serine/threonine phosphatase [Vicinamibacterales bacterium]|nr:PP2C family protein-serine/threonine phosphatase [Vicinamibacterales bacterium]
MPRRSINALPDLIRALPARQLIHFWIAIFSTFSSLGFVLDVLAGGRQPSPLLALNVLACGLLAIGYAKVTLPKQRWGFIAILAAHLAYVFVVPGFFTPLPATPAGRLVIDAIGMIVTVTVGYTFFLTFISVTATRYLRARAEIAIASDIHRVLVPAVEKRIGDFEFLGWSVASGDVGGDLVDLVERDTGWLGYVADVSGHGVGPGVVVGMFKSALRMRALSGGSIASLLDDIHAVLMPLKQPQMFVTVACVRGGPGDEVECAVAGHLPILRVRSGCIEEVTSPQIAVGMFDGTRFSSSSVDCQPGDLFALLTDGLIEVFDAKRNELGLEWAKDVLRSSGNQPLSTIANRLLADARAHGSQVDDQTVLLIRRNAER